MNTEDAKTQIMRSLAKGLASRQIDDESVEKLADMVVGSKYPVIDFDVCTHGICLDFKIDGTLPDLDLNDLLKGSAGPIHSVEIFPKGIISPEFLQVRVTQRIGRP